MTISMAEIVFWVAGFLLNSVLLGTLLLKRGSAAQPWFTAWIGFGCTNSIGLFCMYRSGSPDLYSLMFWLGALTDLLLQVAVLLEVAHALLNRDGRWVEGARTAYRRFAILAVAGASTTFFLTNASTAGVDAIFARFNMFMTALFCLLLMGVLQVSRSFRLVWNLRLTHAAYGLISWNSVSFVVDLCHTLPISRNHFSHLEYLRSSAYLAVVVYWVRLYWLPEQQPVVAPPGLTEDLHRIEVHLRTDRSPLTLPEAP